MIAQIYDVLTYRAQQENKPLPKLNEVTTAFENKDLDALIISWQNRIKMKLWDKVSNINQVTAEIVLKDKPWADVVYLLFIDNELVYLQTHIPFIDGYQPITNNNVKAISDNHILKIAESAAWNQIVDEIWNELG